MTAQEAAGPRDGCKLRNSTHSGHKQSTGTGLGWVEDSWTGVLLWSEGDGLHPTHEETEAQRCHTFNAQSHTFDKWQKQDLNPSPSHPKVCESSTLLDVSPSWPCSALASPGHSPLSRNLYWPWPSRGPRGVSCASSAAAALSRAWTLQGRCCPLWPRFLSYLGFYE